MVLVCFPNGLTLDNDPAMLSEVIGTEGLEGTM
jgi:hypothetical protein